MFYNVIRRTAQDNLLLEFINLAARSHIRFYKLRDRGTVFWEFPQLFCGFCQASIGARTSLVHGQQRCSCNPGFQYVQHSYCAVNLATRPHKISCQKSRYNDLQRKSVITSIDVLVTKFNGLYRRCRNQYIFQKIRHSFFFRRSDKK